MHQHAKKLGIENHYNIGHDQHKWSYANVSIDMRKSLLLHTAEDTTNVFTL